MPAHRHCLGPIVATPSALQFLKDSRVDAIALLGRHLRGDWGIVATDSIAANEESIRLQHGTVLSVYEFPAGTIWISTCLSEDETYTTLLMPQDW